MKWTYSVYVFGICVLFATGSIAGAQIIDDENACTWGISNDALTIPSGSVMTQAVLVLSNVRSTRSDAALYVQLLDNPNTELEELTDEQSGNYFDAHGTLLKDVTASELSSTPQTITIDLNEINDDQSWAWNIFETAPVITLADATTVTCSSAMLSLFDYAGTGRSFGLGIDCDGVAVDSITLSITVESTTELTSTETLTFSAGDINNAPVLAMIDDQTVTEMSIISFTVTASDADNDELSYTAENLPDGAIFRGQALTWIPDYTQAGTYQVTITVDDGVDSDSQTVAISVQDKNQSPVLDSIEDQTVAEGQTLTFTVDADDADNDSLTYTVSNLPDGAVFSRQTFTWTPDYTQAGTYKIAFAATDGIDTDSQAVMITVSNTNQTPELDTIGDQTVAEGQTLTFNISATDPDGDDVTFKIINLPDGAALKDSTFSWTPDYDQNGIYKIVVIATDGTSSSNESCIITVNNTNRAPVLSSIDDQTVVVNETLTFAVSSSDADGDTVSLSVQNLPDGATFKDGIFTFTPAEEQIGTYTVTITAEDASGDTDTITVQITVKASEKEWVQLLYEDFESGMGSFTDGGRDCKFYTGGSYAFQGSNAVDIQDNSGTLSSFQLTESLDLTTYSEMTVEFSFFAVSMDNSSENFLLQYWDGSRWTTVQSWAYGTDFKNKVFYSKTVTLTADSYTFSGNAKIRFMCDASSNYDDVYIDAITISAK